MINTLYEKNVIFIMGVKFWRKVEAVLFHTGRSKRWLSDTTGIEYQSLIQMILRAREPRLSIVKKIAQAFNVSIDELADHLSEEQVITHDAVFQKSKIKKLLRRSHANIVRVLDELESGSTISAQHGREKNEAQELYGQEVKKDSVPDAVPKVQEEIEESTVQIRYYQDIAAGHPRVAVPEEFHTVPMDLLPRGADPLNYALFAIRGTSMKNLDFHDGERILVRQQHDAREGDLVIAYLEEDDGCTFKKLEVIPWDAENPAVGGDYFLCWQDGSKQRYRLRFPRDLICGVFVGKLPASHS